MELGVIGDGPAAEAIGAAISDCSHTVRWIEPDPPADSSDQSSKGWPATGAVVAPAGASEFERANTAFDRWVAVEIGGMGGQPRADIDAAVSTFGPESACYTCLETRVAAHGDATAAEPTGVPATIRFAGAIAGHRLVSLVNGDAAGGRLRAVPGADRTLLPVPNCACAAESPDDILSPDDTFSLDYRDVSVDDSLARAEQAVDDELGLLAAIGERDSFPVPYYIAELGDTTGFSDAAAAEYAAGADTDWDRAYMKALGEGLERYSAGVYRTADSRTGREREVPNPVPPRRFVCPENRELPAPDEPVRWVSGQELPTGAAVSLPAEFVRFPPAAKRFRQSITTGLAAGNSTVEAVVNGLYETIERDATMLGWYSTYEPLELAVEGDHLTELHERARAKSLTVSLLVMTQDIDIPVVAAAVHRDGEWPQFAAGSAAALDGVAAARSALAEAVQNWMELRAMGPEQAATAGGAIAEYADFPAAAQTFVDPEATVSAAAIGEPALTGRAELDAVCNRLSAVDLDAYAARITTRDVAALGFEVVRVLVPKAQPLFTGEPVFGERAREVPHSMGFEPRLDRSYHPYP